MTLTRKPGSYLKRVAFPDRPAGLARTPWARSVPGIAMQRAECITGSRTGNPPAAESRVKGAAAKRAAGSSGRRESFPPAVAALIDARDPWCIHCGSPRDLQRQCNSARICRTCHEWVHSGKGRREAEAEGLIIPRSTTEPYRKSVLVHTPEDGGGMQQYPLCDGTYADEQPGLVAA
jgi:hypothetical protein